MKYLKKFGSRNSFCKNIKNKKQTVSNQSIINFFIGFLAVFSIVFYLFQVNSIATKGYKIQDLEKEIVQLEEHNKKLSIESLQLQSMSEMNEKVRNLNMVAVEKVNYLELTEGVVTARK